MVLPVSQYYANTQQMPIRKRKKDLNPQNAALPNDLIESVDNAYTLNQSSDENWTVPSIATTPQYDELAVSSSSTASSIDHSNNNRI